MGNVLKMINRKKLIYYISVFGVLLAVLVHIVNNMTPVFFVDHVAMMDRVYRFKTGQMFLEEYLFTAHGNALHLFVYITALIDSIFFHDMPTVQSFLLVIGMIGTSIIFSYYFYSSKLPLLLNIAATSIAVIIISGGYNFQLYLPFQMVMVFSRLLYLLCIILLLKSFKVADNRKNVVLWFVLIIASSIVALSSGVGLLFAIIVFYIHIIFRRPLKQIVGATLPIIAYMVIQLKYNHGFNEVSRASTTLSYEKVVVLLKGICAYFGGLPHLLFNCSDRNAVILGAIVLIFTIITLLLFSAQEFFCRKDLEFLNIGDCIKNNSIEKGVWIAMLAIAVLASISASVYSVARIELVKRELYIAIIEVFIAERYLTFSIIPYLLFLRLCSCATAKVNNKNIVSVISVTLVFVFAYMSYIGTKKVIQKNKDIDYSGSAILAGVDVHDKIAENVYPGFKTDWYWKDEVPKLIEHFKVDKTYLWNNIGVGEKIKISKNYYRFSKFVLSDFNKEYYQIYGEVTRFSAGRFLAIVNDEKIIGFATIMDNGGVKLDKGRFYYRNSYIVRGFVKKSLISNDNKLYIADYKNVEGINLNDSDDTSNLTYQGSIELENITNNDGFFKGVFRVNNCLVIKNTAENLAIVKNAKEVKTKDFTKTAKIDSIKINKNTIEIYLTHYHRTLDGFYYPNKILVFGTRKIPN